MKKKNEKKKTFYQAAYPFKDHQLSVNGDGAWVQCSLNVKDCKVFSKSVNECGRGSVANKEGIDNLLMNTKIRVGATSCHFTVSLIVALVLDVTHV